jgi:hypothetical protein
MPRNGRGGARQGTPNKAYANRTDLNNPKPLPITAATGQQYGQATAQKNAQKIVPMASGNLGIGNQQGQPPQGSQGPPSYSGPQPGSMPDLFGPTQNPNEHFMTGVNAGPGQGSEALTSMTPAPTIAALGLLKTLPDPSPHVKMIIAYLTASAANGATY